MPLVAGCGFAPRSSGPGCVRHQQAALCSGVSALSGSRRRGQLGAFRVGRVTRLTSSSVFRSLQKYVREQILLAVAVIVKRGSLDKSIDCKSIFHEVSQLISSGNPTVVSAARAPRWRPWTERRRPRGMCRGRGPRHRGVRGRHRNGVERLSGGRCPLLSPDARFLHLYEPSTAAGDDRAVWMGWEAEPAVRPPGALPACTVRGVCPPAAQPHRRVTRGPPRPPLPASCPPLGDASCLHSESSVMATLLAAGRGGWCLSSAGNRGWTWLCLAMGP